MNIFFYENNKTLYYFSITFYISSIIFFLISLLSYNATDNSFFYVSSNPHNATNYCGFIGAQIAAVLFYLFGGASFLLVIPLLYGGFIFFIKRSFRSEWERLCAALYLPFVGAALLTVYEIDFLWSPYPGGRMGLLFTQKLVYYFDNIGCIFFLYSSLGAILILLFRWSFMYAVQFSISSITTVYLLMKKYHVISTIADTVASFLYFVLIRFPLLVSHFVTSLFDETTFYGTGLLCPEDGYEQIQHVTAQKYQNLHFFTMPLFPKSGEHKINSIISYVIVTKSNKGYIQKILNVHNKYTACVTDCKNVQNNSMSTIIKPVLHYTLPYMNIFIAEKYAIDNNDDENELRQRAYILQDKLKRFGINGEIVAIKQGPVVTLFEYQPDANTKLSKIIVLEDDLAMALQALSIRIIAPIPGRSVVGFEVSNTLRHDVLFSQVATQAIYTQFSGDLPLVLGKDTIGSVVVVDLAKMPHLLIAGSTGSGKSVALNAILISLLCKLSPDKLKLILIDPKRLEFAAFTDIAHLLFPVVTSPINATLVLRWVVQEMEERYEKMAQHGARNITDYNNKIISAFKTSSKKYDSDQHKNEKNALPFIVVMIDELADLMITAGRDVESLITRITQMARAAGIHMIVATQRPSVDVITGLIKANFPSRISFRVTSRIDSRTILDTMGADRLLGKGDMLFLDATTSQLKRVHGAYVSDKEIEQVVNHIHQQQKVTYLDMNSIVSLHKQDSLEINDALYEDIKVFLKEIDEISISLLQRKFHIGYNRSARIIGLLESQGLIMPQNDGKMRKVIR
ncbi:MAG TPA: DNA translocase FtsK [Candidatus Babeliales bacterium]|nr:DNA translocase FtsK [Candidatus Babeliales bacterium]